MNICNPAYPKFMILSLPVFLNDTGAILYCINYDELCKVKTRHGRKSRCTFLSLLYLIGKW